MARSKYNQGIYTPRNKSKCKSKLCIYRSSLELKYMRWLDNNPNIVSWGSESVVLPYVKPTDGKVHKYFLDFVFTILDKNKNPHKVIVEVKPARQCKPPTRHGNKKPKTILIENINWKVNSSKWESAKKWADKNGYIFKIVTEHDIAKLK